MRGTQNRTNQVAFPEFSFFHKNLFLMLTALEKRASDSVFPQTLEYLHVQMNSRNRKVLIARIKAKVLNK